MIIMVICHLAGAIVLPLLPQSVISTTLWSMTCHQIPDRSFSILGVVMLICGRCTGIYLGFLLCRFWFGLSTKNFIEGLKLKLFKGKNQKLFLSLLLMAMLELHLSMVGILQSNNWIRLLEGIGAGFGYTVIFHGYVMHLFLSINFKSMNFKKVRLH